MSVALDDKPNPVDAQWEHHRSRRGRCQTRLVSPQCASLTQSSYLIHRETEHMQQNGVRVGT
jgi:hypothetical protein